MKIIYISIEVKARELLSKLFFIGNNINKDFTFFIGDKLAIKRAINLFGKGIYFYKSINKNDTKHITTIKNKENIYVSLDEEGGYVQSNYNYLDAFLQYRSSLKNVSLVDRIYTWGDFDFKVWRKKYRNHKKKIIRTGSPRLDLWRKDVYPKIFKEDIKQLKEKYGLFFFIPSTFYSSNSDLSMALSNEKKVKKNETSISLKKRIEAKKYTYYLFKVFVSLIKKLSRDFPGHKILIKPHPTENLDNWKKKFNLNKYNNIVFENNYDLTAYIAASDCVIFNSSTAGIQSVIMEKKNIVFNGSKKDKSFRNFPNLCAKQINNYSLLKQELKKEFRPKQNQKYLKKIKSRIYITKETCSKIIFNDIKKISKKQQNNTNLNSSKIKLLSLIYIIIDRFFFVLSQIKSLVKSKKNIHLGSYKRKMGDGIYKNDIKAFFNKLNLKTKLEITQFGKNGYLINKKK